VSCENPEGNKACAAENNAESKPAESEIGQTSESKDEDVMESNGVPSESKAGAVVGSPGAAVRCENTEGSKACAPENNAESNPAEIDDHEHNVVTAPNSNLDLASVITTTSAAASITSAVEPMAPIKNPTTPTAGSIKVRTVTPSKVQPSPPGVTYQTKTDSASTDPSPPVVTIHLTSNAPSTAPIVPNTTFLKPSSEEAIAKYGLIMNFVNRVQLQGVITPTCQTTCATKQGLQWEGALVMMTLGLQPKETKGVSLQDFSASLNTWMPPFYRFQCEMYFLACYQIFTCQGLKHHAGHQVLSPADVDLIIQNVLTQHNEEERALLVNIRQQLSASQSHLLPQPLKACFTEQENTLLMEYLPKKGKASETIREIRSYTPPFAYFPITRESIQRLSPKGWLNDTVIDFFLRLLCRQQRGEQGAIFLSEYNHAFSTQFWAKLNGHSELGEAIKYDFHGVKKWSRRRGVPGRNIFLFNKLAIPINTVHDHWSCAVVSFKTCSIHFYDSIYKDANPEVVDTIFEYLKDEYLDLHDTALPNPESWTLHYTPPPELPTQRNAHDCGVYCCSYVDYLFNQTPMPQNDEEAALRRQHIALTILSASEPTNHE
jgi:Ulp1 protease family, C-terminal catalytic domain